MSSLAVDGVDYVLVIDDGSTDGTQKILNLLSKVDQRLRVFYNKTNLGVAASRNKLIDISDADFICFVDGDDVLIPDAKSEQIRRTNLHEYDLCYSSYIRRSKYDLFKKASYFSKKRLLSSNIIPFSSTIVKKSKIMHHFKEIDHEDYMFWLENTLDGDIERIYYHEDATFYYRYAKDSRSSNILSNIIATYNIQKKFRNRFKVVLSLFTFYLFQRLASKR